MESDSGKLIDALVGEYGWKVASALILATVALYVGREWLRKLVGSTVDKRLAEHKLGLDKDLETHKASLAREAGRLQVENERALQESLLAVKARHDATAKVYAAFLDADNIAESRANCSRVPNGAILAEAALIQRGREAGIDDLQIAPIVSFVRSKRYDEASVALNTLLREREGSLLIGARNSAFDAFYANALYLGEEVIEACKRFMAELQKYAGYMQVIGSDRSGEWIAHRDARRAAFAAVSDVMRRDVGHSKLPSPPTDQA